MKIPEKIDILGVEYQVKITDNIVKDITEAGASPKDNSVTVGYFSSFHETIWLDNKLKKKQLERVFLHEIIEVIRHDLAMQISHGDIDRLEHALYYVLDKNKLLKE